MALYVILEDEGRPELDEKIQERFPGNYIKVADNQWLVSADMIANQVAEQLGVKAGTYGKVMVLQVTGIGQGWHNRDVWEWLRLKSSKS